MKAISIRHVHQLLPTFFFSIKLTLFCSTPTCSLFIFFTGTSSKTCTKNSKLFSKNTAVVWTTTKSCTNIDIGTCSKVRDVGLSSIWHMVLNVSKQCSNSSHDPLHWLYNFFLDIRASPLNPRLLQTVGKQIRSVCRQAQHDGP